MDCRGIGLPAEALRLRSSGADGVPQDDKSACRGDSNKSRSCLHANSHKSPSTLRASERAYMEEERE